MDKVGGHCHGRTSGYKVMDTRLSPEERPGLETQVSIGSGGQGQAEPQPRRKREKPSGYQCKGALIAKSWCMNHPKAEERTENLSRVPEGDIQGWVGALEAR